MKTFFISLGVFLVLIAIILTNYIYMNKICDELDRLANEIRSKAGEEEIAKLENFWEKHQIIMCFTVDYEYINEISERIASIRALFDAGDTFVMREISLLKEDVKEIRRLENLSYASIF